MILIYFWEDKIAIHDDVIKWKHFPRYWPFVQEIHRSPLTWSLDVLFGLRLNTRLSKQSRHRWFKTSSRSLWRHCNVIHYAWALPICADQHSLNRYHATDKLIQLSLPCDINHIAQHQAPYYSDVIMGVMASQIPASRLYAQPFVQAQIKENIGAPSHWHVWGESTGDRWFPLTKGQ